jgi:aspartyl-tRNA synthetase
MMRSDLCSSLSLKDVGRRVILCGWAFRKRDHGGLLFLDLRDASGTIQVVFSPEISKGAHEKAQGVKQEYVVRVEGPVRRRPEGTENPNMETGQIEVLAESIEVLNTCKPLPFQLEEEEPNEFLRLKYRYLDMRRPLIQDVFRKRGQALKLVRDYLSSHGFVEIETPFLTKSTPEGARDFVVPSRLNPGTFYALPQSPQLFKQILMVAGFDRYFQIVRCFRDEDLRSDRQPEFTQIDLEISFVEEDDVIEISEGLIKTLFEELTGSTVTTPFPRLSYDQAMELYGTDKPDLRFPMVLVDLTRAFSDTGLSILREEIERQGVVKGVVFRERSLTRKELETAVEYAKGLGAKGLLWLRKENGLLHSPVAKYLKEKERTAVEESCLLKDGDTLFLMGGKRDRVNELLGKMRLFLAQSYGSSAEGLRFLWITDFPLFEYSEEERRYVARHHPFTSCKGSFKEFSGGYEGIRARAYDLVLNGVEIGGGSIRIHRADEQREMFRLLGIPEREAQEKFGFLLEALELGAPPHGGIAFGFDRILAMALGFESIREVIPFPKTQKGVCPLTGAPSTLEKRQLRELRISLEKEG